jgi:hypothetical protein
MPRASGEGQKRRVRSERAEYVIDRPCVTQAREVHQMGVSACRLCVWREGLLALRSALLHNHVHNLHAAWEFLVGVSGEPAEVTVSTLCALRTLVGGYRKISPTIAREQRCARECDAEVMLR